METSPLPTKRGETSRKLLHRRRLLLRQLTKCGGHHGRRFRIPLHRSPHDFIGTKRFRIIAVRSASPSADPTLSTGSRVIRSPKLLTFAAVLALTACADPAARIAAPGEAASGDCDPRQNGSGNLTECVCRQNGSGSLTCS
jgi:hypothetical protein